MSLDERIAQLVVPGLNGVYTPTDSAAFEKLERLVRQRGVGGFHVFGGGEAVPAVLLNPAHGVRGRTGDQGRPARRSPVLLNRPAARRRGLPLLTSAATSRAAPATSSNGATRLPRAMAIGATGDERLAERCGRGSPPARAAPSAVNVDFYPVVDVNNNPRNPVINLRSFGEDPALGLEDGRRLHQGHPVRRGAFATAKHFPGHGDTNVDTHLGLAVIDHPRERLDQVELVPFKAAIAAGVDAVMSSHIVLPALDPAPGIPATLSRPILTGILRDELKFDGLIFTDSMSMHAISRRFTHEQGGGDGGGSRRRTSCCDPPDPEAALRGIQAPRSTAGRDREARIDRSVERLLQGEGAARAYVTASRLVDVRGGARDALGRRARTLAVARARSAARGDHAREGRAERSVPLAPAARSRTCCCLSAASTTRAAGARAPRGACWCPSSRSASRRSRRSRSHRPLDGGRARPRADARPALGRGGGRHLRAGGLGERPDEPPAPRSRQLLGPLRRSAATRPLVAIAFGSPYVRARSARCRRSIARLRHRRRARGGRGPCPVRRGADRRDAADHDPGAVRLRPRPDARGARSGSTDAVALDGGAGGGRRPG
ncbi:MAG: hypothetical protein MZV64_11695 [Ignavibacteriales bacterium]|nr:hypothetical protein [Ignavibacteriales bacterium]